jgi:hypothetical protein
MDLWGAILFKQEAFFMEESRQYQELIKDLGYESTLGSAIGLQVSSLPESQWVLVHNQGMRGWYLPGSILCRFLIASSTKG